MAAEARGRNETGDSVLTRSVRLKGFRVKDGKVIRDEKRLDVSARLRQGASKKIRVKRRGSA